MNIPSTVAALAAVGLACGATSATAYPLHHHRHHVARAHGFPHYAYRPRVFAYAGRPYYPGPRPYYSAPRPYGYGYGYAPPAYNGGPYGAAQIIEDATIRAQHEPGVTSELAPDAKQTATGGPSGGVPGFSGF